MSSPGFGGVTTFPSGLNPGTSCFGLISYPSGISGIGVSPPTVGSFGLFLYVGFGVFGISFPPSSTKITFPNGLYTTVSLASGFVGVTSFPPACALSA